jgi:hypothetical protein
MSRTVSKVIKQIEVIKAASLITLITLITLTTSYGQANINSPYSRYGVGDIHFAGTARSIGMGRLGIAIASPYNMNFTNPASYASLGLTTYDVGLSGNKTWLTSSRDQTSSGNASFDYFGFGFPVKAGKWGVAFGLMPYSNIGYDIAAFDVSSDPGIVRYTYNGKGGINQFFMGTGFHIAKHLSAGVNVGYLFGTMNQIRTVDFIDNTNYYNTRITDQISVGDFHFVYGLQYTIDSLKISPSDSIIGIRHRIDVINKEIRIMNNVLNSYKKRISTGPETEEIKTAMAAVQDSIVRLNKEVDAQHEIEKNVLNKKAKRDWSLNFGATLSLTESTHATRSSLSQLYILNPFGYTITKDTAQNIQGESGNITLPLTAGFGVTMRKGSQWLIGADVTAQDWTNYRSFGRSDSLTNSVQISVGTQFTPDERSIHDYSKVIQYRLGFHYAQTYLHLKNTDITDYGVSLGFGLPVRKALSVIQVAFEYGNMGTLQNQLVEMKYFRFVLGFTFNDLWFVKPHID